MTKLKLSKEIKYLSSHERRIRQTFKKYQDRSSWKKPIEAIIMNKNEAYRLAEGIRWYHGVKATITKVEVPVRHKEGLVWLRGTGYLVKSIGYQCD